MQISKTPIDNSIFSSLNHAGLDTEIMNNGEISIDGITPFDMVVRVEVGTGICGEGWSSNNILPKGTNISDFGQQCAEDNAMSFGHMEDEEADKENGFDDSDLEYMVYWYHPSISGALINGGNPIREIMADIEKEGLDHNPLNELFYIPDLETCDQLLDDI